MNKVGRVSSVALLLVVAVFYVSTGHYASAAAWFSLGLAIYLASERPATRAIAPKILRQYAALLCLLLALGVFGYQLYQDLTP